MATELELFTKGIADAIRTQEKSKDKIQPRDFESRILALKTGGGESDGGGLNEYLIEYVEQEDGSYEMRIKDYIEGAQGQKVLIGTYQNEDAVDFYVMEY